MGNLRYNITGLQEFIVTFQDYCVTCEFQKNCKYGKNTPFQVTIDCNEIRAAEEKKKAEKMDKLAKDNPDWDWDQREEGEITRAQVFSQMWADKVKNLKEEIYCLDSRKQDSMLVSQRGEEWWTDFRDIMAEIDQECSKIC